VSSQTLIDDFTIELSKGSELGLALALAAMMFSVALGLTPSSFRFLRTKPRAFFVGVFSQLIALPCLALVLCYLLNPMPSVALGMILISCCPGGNVSNMLVLLARGNVALSISLTACSSVSAAFITPIAILFWSGLYAPTAELLTAIEFDKLTFLLQTATVLGLPLVLGILCNVYWPKYAELIRKPLVVLSSAWLLIIVISGAVQYWQAFLSIGTGLLLIIAFHNVAAFTLGNTIARLASLDVADRRALSFEVGIQNAGLGIVILLTQLGGLGGALIVAGLWGTWHIIAGLILAALFKLYPKL